MARRYGRRNRNGERKPAVANRRALVREALRAAVADSDPDARHLVDAAPAIMRDAKRRRRNAEDAGLLGAAIPLAWRAIPGMTAAAVLLAGISLGLFVTESKSAGGQSLQSVNAVILGGETVTAETDLVFQAIVAEENGNG